MTDALYENTLRIEVYCPVLPFDVDAGLWPVILTTTGVTHNKSEFRPRMLHLLIELIIDDYDGCKTSVFDFTPQYGTHFDWPKIGEGRPMLAEFEITKFQGRRAVELVGFEPIERLGNTHAE